MNVVLNILTLLVCLPWPLMLMFSPMAFGAPGSTTLKNVLVVTLILLYPAALGLLYLSFNWKFFGLSSKLSGGLLIGIPLFAVHLFGYPRSVYLLMRDIPLNGYGVKHGSVYYNGTAFDADPRTFRVIDNYFCGKDARNVYSYSRPIPGADPATFEEVPDTLFYKDQNRVYSRMEAYIVEVPGVRGERFRNHRFVDPFGSEAPSRYFSDGVTAYYSNKLLKVEGLDATKIWVQGAYAGDGTGVFYQGRKLNADAASFVVLYSYERYDRDSTSLAKDRNAVFFGDVAQAVDAGSFEVLDHRYARDAQRVYYIDQSVEVVEGANPQTFKVIAEGNADGVDGEKKFRSGKPYGDGEAR